MPLTDMRILIVTRDRRVHDTTRTLCSRITPTFRGLEWAGSYRVAVEVLERGQVDLCILDLDLINGSGLDLLQEPSLGREDVPVILLLATPPHPEEDPLARSSRVADWILRDELDMASLQRAIRHARRSRENVRGRSRRRRPWEQLSFRLPRALARTRDLEDALRAALGEMVECLSWDVGHAYLRDDDGLRPSRIWCPEGDSYPELRKVTGRTRFEEGQGMVGQALATRRAVWRSDVTADPTFVRRTKRLGVRAALAVPVVADDRVEAVLELFSPEVRESDFQVLDAAERVSSLLAPIAARQRVVDALRTSHGLLTAMVEGIPDALFAKDHEGRYVMMNGAAAGEAGRPVMEALGRRDAELFDPETAAVFRRQDLEVMESGDPVTFEAPLEVEAGVKRAYLVTKTPLRSRSGAIVGVCGVARDVTGLMRVTHRLRAEKEEMETRIHVLEAMLGVGTTLREPGLPVSERLERIAELVCKEGVLGNGGPAEARIVLRGKEFRTGGFDASAPLHRAPIRAADGDVGILEVAVPGANPSEAGGEAVRTSDLLERIALELGTLPVQPEEA